MAQSKSVYHVARKPFLYALLALAGGVALLVFSQLVKIPVERKASTPTTAMAPTTSPASETNGGQDQDRLRKSKRAAANSLSGILLLFSAGCFVISAVCVGWLVTEIRQARPAWQRRQKYPQMRKR